jgi:trimethylamine--corrinoid protein Co-methyltransferase
MSGVGHYLGSSQTIEVMQSEYLYPDFSDRDSPTVWESNGKPVLLDKAIARKDEILAGYFPKHISDEIDRELRESFPIALSAKKMGRS